MPDAPRQLISSNSQVLENSAAPFFPNIPERVDYHPCMVSPVVCPLLK
jgi:hypothetical protein